jgi:hypothetical protein
MQPQKQYHQVDGKSGQAAPERLRFCPQSYHDLLAGKPRMPRLKALHYDKPKNDVAVLSHLLRLLQDKVGQQS